MIPANQTQPTRLHRYRTIRRFERLEQRYLLAAETLFADADAFASRTVDDDSDRSLRAASLESLDLGLQSSSSLESTESSAAELPARQVENLDRGLIAVRRSSSQVYLGWRLLGQDPSEIGFHVYRSTAGEEPIRLTSSPVFQTTDYIDSTADLSQTNRYSIRPVINSVEQTTQKSFELAAQAPIQQRLSIPLQVPPPGDDYDYSANDLSVGDVDGDGEFEFILKWNPSNAKDNAQTGVTGNVYLDAYRLSGEQLWRIDLGHNIRAGSHYTQFMVYDFDGDGAAEVITKTAPGTIDGQGEPVLLGDDQVTDDYRNGGGYIIDGPEYLTVFSGLTGANLSTAPFEPARGSVDQWGDSYGNRADRFTAGVAYLDGSRPSLIFGRGYYHPRTGNDRARNELAAYDYRDGQLSLRWHFRAGENIHDDLNVEYVGQGAHSLSVGDVDFDGRDEIIYGAAAIDDDGTGLYSTGLGHGDALHLADMDPTRPGLEVFMAHEVESEHGGVGGELRDAATGELILSVPGSGDVGRGVAGDIDPNSPGFELWTSANDEIYNVAGETLYGKPSNMFTNFLVWWDADLSRELLDRTTISEWNNPGRSNFDLDPGASGLQWYAPGASHNNGTKATPSLSGDILGDWREEVVWRRSDSSFLDIYTTVIPANNRMITLLHDTQYRTAIAWQNTGYNQPPHPSFYLGAETTTIPRPNIYLAGNSTLVGRGVAYGNATSAYGEELVDPAKIALAPGNDASTANYTNYTRGLNRIVIDFENLPLSTVKDGTLNPEDGFQFRVGNSADPSTWGELSETSEIPLPDSIEVAPGLQEGHHRVILSWADGVIKNSWLQVTVKATATTGLAQDDVFYFGNQVGDVTGNTAGGDHVRVNALDMLILRLNQSASPNSVGIDNPFDVDRSGAVNALDLLQVRLNQDAIGGLLMLSAPADLAPSTQVDVAAFSDAAYSEVGGSSLKDSEPAIPTAPLQQSSPFAGFSSPQSDREGTRFEIVTRQRLSTFRETRRNHRKPEDSMVDDRSRLFIERRVVNRSRSIVERDTAFAELSTSRWSLLAPLPATNRH